jgi:hypothetical protein
MVSGSFCMVHKVTQICEQSKNIFLEAAIAARLAEKFEEPRRDAFPILDFAFPYDQHPPAGGCQRRDVSGVTFLGPRQLWQPEILAGFREDSILACGIRMAVPEASMNENNRATARKDEVRLARKILAVEPISITQRMGNTPDRQFRLRVF